MDGYPFASHIRVRFADTDAQGVAHNSNYFIWFEVARVEFLERFAGGYQRLRDQGIESLVLESHAHFKSPAFFDDHPPLLLAPHLGLLDGEHRGCGERAEEIDIPLLEGPPSPPVDSHQRPDGIPLGAERHDEPRSLGHLAFHVLRCTRKPGLGGCVERANVADDAGTPTFVHGSADAVGDRLRQEQDARPVTAWTARVQATQDERSAALADGSHNCRISANQPAPSVGDEPPHRRRLLARQERLRDFDGRLEALMACDELDNAVGLADGGNRTLTCRHREA